MLAADSSLRTAMDADSIELDGLAVCGYVSDRDGVQVVEIDTTEVTGLREGAY